MATVERPQRAFDRDDEKRHGDKRVRHDHTGQREWQREPGSCVERLAEHAASTEGEQQSRSPDYRWQNHWKGHDGTDDISAGEPNPRQDERQGNADYRADHGGDERRHDRDSQRIENHGRAKQFTKPRPRGASQQANERREEDQHADGRQGDQQCGRAWRTSGTHGAPNPASSSALWARPPVRKSTKRSESPPEPTKLAAT